MEFARTMQMDHVPMELSANSHIQKSKSKKERVMRKKKKKKKHHPKEKPRAGDKEAIQQHPFSHHPRPSPNPGAEQKQNQTTLTQIKHHTPRVIHQGLRVLHLLQGAHQTARVGPQPKGRVTD